MSWQTYVDEHLMCETEGHHLTAAAIVGHDGTVWAQSAAFPQLKTEEMTDVMKDFDEPGHLAPTGMFLGATKYMVIQGEPGAVIRGKKVTSGHARARTRQRARWAQLMICSCVQGVKVAPGSGGVTVKKTGQALIIGIYDEPMTPGQCNLVVERLGDYLIEQGM